MTDHTARFARRCRTAHAPLATGSPVANIAARRDRAANLVESVTFVFGGRNYGTFALALPYAEGVPFRLYVSARASGEVDADGTSAGPVEFLITDDAIADDLHAPIAGDVRSQ